MTMVGYGRVSSAGQCLAIQEEQLENAGCEKLFAEKQRDHQPTTEWRLKRH